MSLRAAARGGTGELSRGGRGGGGVDISILNIALGGGGNGPAVACTPGAIKKEER